MGDGPSRLEIALSAHAYANLQSISEEVTFAAPRRTASTRNLGPAILAARARLKTGSMQSTASAGDPFEVRSDPEAGHVSITLKAATDSLQPEETIQLNRAQLDRLAALLDEAAQARNWLRTHRHLFCRESNLWQPSSVELKAWIAELWRRPEAGP